MKGNVPSSWTLELCDSPVRAEPGVHECCCDSDESKARFTHCSHYMRIFRNVSASMTSSL